MLYREDKKTGKQLSALGFGCMRFPRKGGGIDVSRASAMLYSSIEKGVNYLDTAYIYPGSEAALGQILTPEWRERVYIATKLPLFFVKSHADLDKYFIRQLERLKTDHIDYYLMHMLTNMETWEFLRSIGIEKWIEEKKKNGSIGSVGFSYHGGRGEFPKILDSYDWEFCQLQYNYLDENNQAGKTGMQLAASRDIPVIVMEPLRGGRLAGGLPEAAINAFKAADPGKTPAEWALRWIWNHPEATVVLSGMSEESQVEENIKTASDAAPGSLTEDGLQAVAKARAALEELIKVPCTACGYCMPCPKNVDIPTAFACYNAIFATGMGSARREYMQNADGLSEHNRFAGNCTGCGKCESKCPQSIPIRENLKLVKAALEPWWYKAALSAAGRVTRKRIKKK